MLRNICVYLSAGLLMVLLTGCTSSDAVKVENNDQQVLQNEDGTITFAEPLVEDKRIYDQDKKGEIIHLYVTVLPSQDQGGSGYNFFEINQMGLEESIEKGTPQVEIIFQEGTEQGPSEGDFSVKDTHANATLELRGNTSRRNSNPQKSYQIKLFESTGLWRGHEVINLNKHVFDFTRVRNKLSFDYFTMIPDLTSLRTQFVHLHVKDLTADSPSKQFVDYGLFTQIEQVNKRFLGSHGLDPNGQLYKAVFFEFLPYKDKLRDVSDSEYNEEEFESILRINGRKYHRKLLSMLEEVNDYTLNFNEVFNRYFDRDNYLTWVAVNILFRNMDTSSANFYLYSPLNSNRFYFLPWDYDRGWGYYDTLKLDPALDILEEPWRSGIANYWGSVLHRRFFKDPDNVRALNAKIDSLMEIITKEQTRQLLEAYHPVVSPVVKKLPDLKYLPNQVEGYDKAYWDLVTYPEKQRALYYKEIEKPMPIFLNHSLENNQLVFTWEHSYDLQGDELVYHFQLSSDPNFTSLLLEEKNLKVTKVITSPLPKGVYYWRVTIRDSKGNEQIAFDTYTDKDRNRFFGVKKYVVE